MPTISTNLSSDESAYVRRCSAAESVSHSAYLRRLIQQDMQRADSEALMALSLDAMAQTQQENSRRLGECNTLLHSGFQSVSDQLTDLIKEQASNAERILQANVRLLGVNESTSDLVAAALTDCRDILDATNTVVETIDRRIKALGK
jgi:hypothetical protein